MNNVVEIQVTRWLLCGLVLGTAACGGSVNVDRDQNAAGESGVAGSSGSGTTIPAGSAGVPGNVGGTGTAPDEAPKSCATEADAESWIAFDSDRDAFDREIYMVHPDGSELSRVTKRIGIDQEPAFSYDGKWLSFTSDRGGSLQIYLLELATGEVTQVTHHEGGADQSSFSHDGTLLAFHSGASAYTIGIDGTNEQVVATGPDVYNAYAHPQFTNDDTHLVVDRGNEIDVFALDGSGERMIVQNWTTIIQAPWLSPSGRDVVYQVWCDSDRQASLWTSPFSVKTNPCEGVRLTAASSFDNQHPSWGPNDRIVYSRVDSTNDTGQIVIVPRQRNASPCAVLAPGADDRNPAWSFAQP
jgi:Tol biopolymer transport system component